MLLFRRSRLLITLVVAVLLLAGSLSFSARIGQTAPAPPIYSVLFDNAHAETAGNADWIISTSQPDPLSEDSNPLNETDWTGGASAWGVALHRSGRYSLKTTTTAITYGNGGNPLDLSHFDALVLPEPNIRYTASERTAILSFVSNGGGLIMVADHTGSDRNNDGWDSLEILNELMNNGGASTDLFGIQFAVLNIGSENPSNRPNPSDPVLVGPFGTATGSIIRSGTTAIINTTHNPNVRGVIYRNSFPNTGSAGVFVARSTYGSGRIVAIGDSSTFDDGTCSSGNDCYDGWNDPAGDNNVLFPNASEWVVGVAGTPTVTPTATSTRTRTITPTFTQTVAGMPTATPTVTPTGGSQHIVISEFRTRGPNGGNDEFIELYNPTGSVINIGGWKINGSNNTGTVGTRLTIDANTIIQAHGHFLATNNASGGYNGSVQGDQTFNTGITDDGGIAILDAANVIIDEVGMSAGSAYGEGTRLVALTTNVDRGYQRLPGGNNGSGQDTDNNASDFQIMAPSGPENLDSSPVPPLGTPTATPTSTSTPTSTPSFTNTPVNTPTDTPTVAPILVGHAVWQGRPSQPNAAQQLPITLTLKQGASEFNYPSQTTDASGFFTVSLSGLSSGTYSWRAKNPKYLANVGTVGLQFEGSEGYQVIDSNLPTFLLSNLLTANIEIGLMRAGDCNNDNVVSVGDFNVLRGTFGKAQGDPGYDDRADFTGDHAIGITDFNLLKGSFGASGSPPLQP